MMQQAGLKELPQSWVILNPDLTFFLCVLLYVDIYIHTYIYKLYIIIIIA